MKDAVKRCMVFSGDGVALLADEPLKPGMAMRCHYFSLHVPSGNVYPESALFVNRNSFERTLKRWNAQGHGMWIYAERDPKGAEVEA